MARLEDLVHGRSPLTAQHIHRIQELVADWQLLADLSFADLVLWVPLRKDFKSWPSGYVSVAHIRPTTAATIFTHDVIGDEIEWGSKPLIDQALSHGEIIRDSEPELDGEVMIKVETVPVIFESQVIAVISRHRSAESMSTPSRLELNYREIAHKLYAMVSEGTFPYPGAHEYLDPAPRVGDGLIRLDVNGIISFASPNARSAYNRLGWDNDLEGFNLGEISEEINKKNHDADDEGLRSRLSGKNLQRAECENEGATIDLIVLPLLAKVSRLVKGYFNGFIYFIS